MVVAQIIFVLFALLCLTVYSSDNADVDLTDLGGIDGANLMIDKNSKRINTILQLDNSDAGEDREEEGGDNIGESSETIERKNDSLALDDSLLLSTEELNNLIHFLTISDVQFKKKLEHDIKTFEEYSKKKEMFLIEGEKTQKEATKKFDKLLNTIEKHIQDTISGTQSNDDIVKTPIQGQEEVDEVGDLPPREAFRFKMALRHLHRVLEGNDDDDETVGSNEHSDQADQVKSANLLIHLVMSKMRVEILKFESEKAEEIKKLKIELFKENVKHRLSNLKAAHEMLRNTRKALAGEQNEMNSLDNQMKEILLKMKNQKSNGEVNIDTDKQEEEEGTDNNEIRLKLQSISRAFSQINGDQVGSDNDYNDYDDYSRNNESFRNSRSFRGQSKKISSQNTSSNCGCCNQLSVCSCCCPNCGNSNTDTALQFRFKSSKSRKFSQSKLGSSILAISSEPRTTSTTALLKMMANEFYIPPEEASLSDSYLTEEDLIIDSVKHDMKIP